MIAIVVAFRNGPELGLCCDSLLLCSDVSRIVVVDNSYAEFGSCFERIGYTPGPRILHVRAPGNLGFSGGNNFGVQAVDCEHSGMILFCNPDVVVSEPSIRGLLFEMRDNNLDLISPYMSERTSGGELENLACPAWDMLLGRGLLDVSNRPNRFRYVPSFFGACFIATRTLLSEVGGLSEDFFLYGEEVDYCQRMALTDRRWSVSRAHGVTHSRGASINPLKGRPGKSSVAYLHAARSAMILGRKYWPLGLPLWIAARLLLASVLAVKRDFRSARSVIVGVIQGCSLKLSK